MRLSADCLASNPTSLVVPFPLLVPRFSPPQGLFEIGRYPAMRLESPSRVEKAEAKELLQERINVWSRCWRREENR